MQKMRKKKRLEALVNKGFFTKSVRNDVPLYSLYIVCPLTEDIFLLQNTNFCMQICINSQTFSQTQSVFFKSTIYNL